MLQERDCKGNAAHIIRSILPFCTSDQYVEDEHVTLTRTIGSVLDFYIGVRGRERTNLGCKAIVV